MRIPIRSSAGVYGVYCAAGALRSARGMIERLGGSADASGQIFLLSSPRVWKHLGKELRSAFGVGRERTILFDDREAAKRLGTVEKLARALRRAGADRHSTVIAAGGGVVGDVAGFAAATYLRGVRLAHIPTTLVAQVDSAIGGKTGVNLPEGKNLVGAFFPPRLVIADPLLLRSLPEREFRSGLYEVAKYGVIADAELFEFLERQMPAILRRDPKALGWIIPRCIAIKARVVGTDERESGLRQILNFGHTLGHAFEAATGYRRFLHGEAVGWGMIAATLIALVREAISEPDAARIVRLIRRIGPLPRLGRMGPARLRQIALGDKKTRGGQIRWVLPRRIGNVAWGEEVPWQIVERVLAELSSLARFADA